jgi:hypothetical protein
MRETVLSRLVIHVTAAESGMNILRMGFLTFLYIDPSFSDISLDLKVISLAFAY